MPVKKDEQIDSEDDDEEVEDDDEDQKNKWGESASEQKKREQGRNMFWRFELIAAKPLCWS